VDEGRKRVLLIAASILVSRKLVQMDTRPTPALSSAIHDSVIFAERIMKKIDDLFPGRA